MTDTPAIKPPDESPWGGDGNLIDQPKPASRVLVLLAVLCAVVLLTLGVWSSYWADWRNDQYQLINLGQCVADGGRMYVDVWENKPPGIAWINALGVGLGELGPWVLPGVVGALGLMIMGIMIARLLSHTTACAMLILAAALFSMRAYDASSINPDFYSAVFDLAACSLWIAALFATRRSGIFGLAVCAGLLWAASTTVKQTGAVGPLGVTVVALFALIFQRPRRGVWLGTCGSVWVGFALGAAAVVGVLNQRGTVDSAWEAVYTFNQGLVHFDQLGGLHNAWQRIQSNLGTLVLPLWLGLAGLVATWLTGKRSRLSASLATLLVLWLAAQIALALLGPSRSERYWQATFPSLLWLAAIGVYQLEMTFREVPQSRRSVFALLGVTIVLLLGRPMFEQYRIGVATSRAAYAKTNTQRDELRAMGEQLNALIPNGWSIYVMDYDIGVYVYSGRRPTSRFTYPRSAEQMSEILADLAEGKAGAILMPKSASAEFDRWCDEPCQEKVTNILAAYEEKGSVGSYTVWVFKE